jgi:hypothetical protein
VPRLTDIVKEVWEDQTLALFMNHRRAAGGPNYEFVEQRERPDRVIRVVGTDDVIGVEITRCVAPADAAKTQQEIEFADSVKRELSRWAPGGHFHLLAGDFPDCDRAAIERLVSTLNSRIRAAGSLAAFLGSLGDGCWRYGGTTFHLTSETGDDHWSLSDNHLPRPRRRSAPASEIDRLLSDRITDKATKAAGYGWKGRLLLLVRNPYQVHRPSDGVLDAARRVLRATFHEAWLVNHREGALDISPPEPRLVSLLF